MLTQIECIKHSAVIIAASYIRLLSAPWFDEDAFHKR